MECHSAMPIAIYEMTFANDKCEMTFANDYCEMTNVKCYCYMRLISISLGLEWMTSKLTNLSFIL
jgi:hypothetical protein